MIFADTSFWIAYRNSRDGLHHHATTAMRKHAGDGIVTTNHIVGETWTFLRRRTGFKSAVNFVDSVQRSRRVQVKTVSEEMERAALSWLRRRGGERPYSFVDATSFEMMRTLKIRDALAFDQDFAAAGFRPIETS